MIHTVHNIACSDVNFNPSSITLSHEEGDKFIKLIVSPRSGTQPMILGSTELINLITKLQKIHQKII